MLIDKSGKSYVMVVCDIDGTLLTDELALTDKTIAMIKKLHEQGVMFALSSGRPIKSYLKKTVKSWNLGFQPELYIGLNGCEIYDGLNNKYYEFNNLTKEQIKLIVTKMNAVNVECFIYRKTFSLLQRLSEGDRAALNRNHNQFREVKYPSEIWSQPTPVVLTRMGGYDCSKIKEYTKTWLPEDVKVFNSKPTMLEFTNIHVSKGDALEKFCRINSIDIQQVISFGDSTNDNSSLKAAGLGVCMSNGLKDTMESADVINPYSNNEDGVARYLEENFTFGE